MLESDSLQLQGHTGRISGLVFSADSRWLVNASNDKTLRVWGVAPGGASKIASSSTVLAGHSDLVSSVAISGDGLFAASGSYDKTARIWPLAPHALVPIACKAAGRSLTEDEWERFLPTVPYRRTCG